MRKTALFALTPLVAVAIAACGGTSYGAAHPTAATHKSAASPIPAAHTVATVAVGTSRLGKILVGSNGRTLYEFAADKSARSTCYGACASVWPPLTVTVAPRPGAQIKASLLSTSRRTDGTTQVTYAGHPLYYYEGDAQAGQTTGQALSQFGAAWYVLTPSGTVVTHG